jgi:hypothetical protein
VIHGPRIAVVGDLQRTSKLEFWRRQNDAERERIVAAIAGDRPHLLILLGDLVFQGSSEKHWRRFDRLFAPIREAGIETRPVIGNHEYRGGGAGIDFLFERFPEMERRRWTEVRRGELALILLDDNRERLGEKEFAEQMAWYHERLAVADGHDHIRAVLVFTHHPPRTNAWVLPDDPVTTEHVLPPFLAAEKTLALLSGHAHAHERFEEAGKTLIVTGGGGGPQMRLRRGRARRHEDLAPGGALRDFHYLTIAPSDAGLAVTVRGLARGETELGEIDRFDLAPAGDGS